MDTSVDLKTNKTDKQRFSKHEEGYHQNINQTRQRTKETLLGLFRSACEHVSVMSNQVIQRKEL